MSILVGKNGYGGRNRKEGDHFSAINVKQRKSTGSGMRQQTFKAYSQGCISSRKYAIAFPSLKWHREQRTKCSNA